MPAMENDSAMSVDSTEAGTTTAQTEHTNFLMRWVVIPTPIAAAIVLAYTANVVYILVTDTLRACIMLGIGAIAGIILGRMFASNKRPNLVIDADKLAGRSPRQAKLIVHWARVRSCRMYSAILMALLAITVVVLDLQAQHLI